MLFDTHCHLHSSKYKEKGSKILDEAFEWNVNKFVTVGTNLKKSRQALKIAKLHDAVYASVGIYPHDEKKLTLEQQYEALQNLINENSHNGKIVAIGECGIDNVEYSHMRPVVEQIPLFEMQIELAIKNDLPIIIHNRDGDEHVLTALKKYSAEPKLRGICHCFVGNWETAQKFLDLNFYISFSGIITYPSGKSILETVEKIPNDKFVIETDAPYLAPQGYRNQVNEPKYVKMVAEKVADAKKLSLKKVSDFSYKNSLKIYNIKA